MAAVRKDSPPGVLLIDDDVSLTKADCRQLAVDWATSRGLAIDPIDDDPSEWQVVRAWWAGGDVGFAAEHHKGVTGVLVVNLPSHLHPAGDV